MKLQFNSLNSELIRARSCPDKLKIGLIGRKGNNIDYNDTSGSIRISEKKLLSKALNLPEKKILFLNQIHGDDIVTIHSHPEKTESFIADADGMATDMKNLCLVIRTADCVPVFIFDKKNSVLGAVHSGWKGCRLRISQKLAQLMKNRFNSEYSQMLVYILPSIGPDSYEISEDVADHFKDHTIKKNDKIYLNLWENIEVSLIKEGIPARNIFNSGICNLQNTDLFFSHRNGDLGRNLNFAFISS